MSPLLLLLLLLAEGQYRLQYWHVVLLQLQVGAPGSTGCLLNRCQGWKGSSWGHLAVHPATATITQT
jgi:hypothetical protein